MAYEAEEEEVRRRRSMEVKEQGAAADLISSIVGKGKREDRRIDRKSVV